MDLKEFNERSFKIRFLIFLVQNLKEPQGYLEKDDVDQVSEIVNRKVELNDLLGLPLYTMLFCGFTELGLRKRSSLYRLTLNTSISMDFCKISLLPMCLELRNKVKRFRKNQEILGKIAEKYDFNDEKFKSLKNSNVVVLNSDKI